jgi:hypothetical protein
MLDHLMVYRIVQIRQISHRIALTPSFTLAV